MQFGIENYVNKNRVLSSIIISMGSRKNAKNTLKLFFMSSEYISYWGQHLKTKNICKNLEFFRGFWITCIFNSDIGNVVNFTGFE